MSVLVSRIDAKTGDKKRINSLVEYMYSPGHSNKSERVIASGTNNLYAETPQGIAEEMRYTADAAHGNDKRKSVDPFEHFVLSWSADEPPTPDDFKRAVEIAVEELGIKDHQYTWAAHDDTGNLHAHLAISRVNPKTLHYVHLPFVVKQAEKCGARINHELGYKSMQNNRYYVNENNEIESFKSTKVANIETFSEIVKSAKNWEEFHTRTQAIGINYVKKGNGGVINGEKASDVDRNASFSKLVKRFGAYIGPEHTPIKPAPEMPVVVVTRENRERAAVELNEKIGASIAEMQKINERGYANSHIGFMAPTPTPTPTPTPKKVSSYQKNKEEIARIKDGLRKQQADERSANYIHYKAAKSAVYGNKSLTYGQKKARLAELAIIYDKEKKRLANVHAMDRAKLAQVSRDKLKSIPKPTQVRDEAWGQVNTPQQVRTIRDYRGTVMSNGHDISYSLGRHSEVEFIDMGNKVALMRRTPESTLAMLQLSQAKFGEFVIKGDKKFMEEAVKIAAAHGMKIVNPELQEAIKAEVDRLKKEKDFTMEQHKKPVTELQRMADAMGVDRFRVTLVNYDETKLIKNGKPVLNEKGDAKMQNATRVLRVADAPALTPPELSKPGTKGNDALTVDMISGKMDQLTRDSEKKKIILSTFSQDKHIVHIDDVTADKLAEMKRDGFNPAVIINTSPNHNSVILTAPKDITQTPAANHAVSRRLTQTLNARYGDPLVKNGNQPFRLPGLDNRKPKYQGADGKYPEIKLLHAERGHCSKLDALAKKELSAHVEQTKVIAEQRTVAQRETPAVHHMEPGQVNTQASAAYLLHHQNIIREASRIGIKPLADGKPDMSRVDVLTSQRMLITGWKSEDIAHAMRNENSEARTRAGATAQIHSDPGYADRIVAATVYSDLRKQAKFTGMYIKQEQAAKLGSPMVRDKIAQHGVDKTIKVMQARHERDPEQNKQLDKEAKTKAQEKANSPAVKEKVRTSEHLDKAAAPAPSPAPAPAPAPTQAGQRSAEEIAQRRAQFEAEARARRLEEERKRQRPGPGMSR